MGSVLKRPHHRKMSGAAAGQRQMGYSSPGCRLGTTGFLEPNSSKKGAKLQDHSVHDRGRTDTGGPKFAAAEQGRAPSRLPLGGRNSGTDAGVMPLRCSTAGLECPSSSSCWPGGSGLTLLSPGQCLISRRLRPDPDNISTTPPRLSSDERGCFFI